MRIAQKLLLALFGLLLPVIGAEIYLRTSHRIPEEHLLPYPYQYESIREVAAGRSYVSFDRDLGWVPTPGSAVRVEGATYFINQATLRATREYSLQPAPGVRRISAFGDSYTFCWNVSQDDCWTTSVQQGLRGTEVLNFGVPAYAPDQAWLRYQRDGRDYGSCAVLIGYMTENVYRVVNRFRPFYKPDGVALSKPRFLLDDDDLRLLPSDVIDASELQDPAWVERTLGPRDSWYFPGVFVANPLDWLLTERVLRTAAYRYRREGEINFNDNLEREPDRAYQRPGEAFTVAGRVLINFYRQVQRDGPTPVVIVFGNKTDIEDRARGEPKVYQPMLDWLDREGVRYIDVTDDLAQQAARAGIRSVIANHYRPLGNQLVARKLERELPPLIAPTCGV